MARGIELPTLSSKPLSTQLHLNKKKKIIKAQIYNYMMPFLLLLLYTNFSCVTVTWTSDYETDGI